MTATMEKKPLPKARVRRGWRVALLDMAAMALLALWLLFALGVLYPHYLANTAPEQALPYIATQAEQAQAVLTAESTPEEHTRVLALRETWWQRALLLGQAAGAVLMLLCVYGWRLHARRHALPYGRQMRRALHTCRVTGLVILAVEGALAWLCWQYGLRFVEGRTVWDYVCALAGYPLSYLVSVVLRRFGAPACFCARHGAFHRL